MKNIIKSYFGNKRGMTLVEVLTAMAILSLIIFCFTPLFLTYYDAIVIAGDEVKDVQEQSGILQTVIGNFDAGKGGNYSANVTTIDLELTTPGTATLSRTNSNGATISTTMNGAVTVALGHDIDNVKGDFLVSDPENLKNGYTTIKAQGSSSGLVCYPKSLTDDFIEAKIIVYGSGGINFADASYMNDFKLSCGLEGKTNLSNGTDYTVRKLASSMVEFTIYGGGKVSFETSPLVINYKNGQHILKVEVDSPSMIMVGEKSDDGKYYYYVSRGEIVDGADSDTTKNEIAIIRREMNSVDPNANNSVTKLTSAMNDVEWVPAESADKYARYDKDGNGVVEDDEKYGYYVMCGDNGQVRRFWRNNTTGNYYWGGDHTYYTDYNLNRFSNAMYMYTTNEEGAPSQKPVYNTGVSFKYIAMRPMKWESGTVQKDGVISFTDATHNANQFRTGFNMSSKKDSLGWAHLRNLCTVSVTYGDDVQFYATDGQIYWYLGAKETAIWTPANPNVAIDSSTPSYNNIVSWQTQNGSYNGHEVWKASGQKVDYKTHDAWTWLDPGDGTSSYYTVNNIPDSKKTASYPITLTSVDAIRIDNALGTDGEIVENAAYEKNVRNNNNYFVTGVIPDTDTSGDATKGTEASASLPLNENLLYPTSNYVLYCGYIPAYMDAWAATSGIDSKYAIPLKWAEAFAIHDGGTYSALNSKIGRASNRTTLEKNVQYYGLWRMTMGVTPFFTTGDSLEMEKGEGKGQRAYQYTYNGLQDWKNYHWAENIIYYPYTNLEYAITGKYYDINTYNQRRTEIENMFKTDKVIASPALVTTQADINQNNATGGEIVDITISYLSHPLAISISANPTDDVVYDLSNDKANQIFYWHNRREAITFLDAASTVIPNGDKDVPVSLMVGYVLGGTVRYNEDSGTSVDVTSVMNNGIVFLRSGTYNTGRHSSSNAATGEYKATDNTGYLLEQESNVFHQFYYLNSRTILPEKILGIDINKDSTGYHGEYAEEPKEGKSIGNLYGAEYWQNNRHIQYRSITGGAPTDGSNTSSSYEYLRSHPMTNTKVTCVAWGVTWQGYPEAMWGTENGTVLSWWVNTTEAKNLGADGAAYWNDRSVDAEFQSYKWVDNVNGKTFANNGNESGFIDTIGSAKWGDKKADGIAFSIGSDRYKYFYDKTSQATGRWGSIGFISTLENINDIAYDNDYWVAVGDQSDKDPADYCASGTWSGGGEVAKAFTENGRGGSWVNVRYWVDANGSGKQADDNAYYHWRAVKISTKDNYNIVQINNVNGIWIATGYEDANNNEEYDNGERTVVCWARDPLRSCNETSAGGWSEKVQFYANNGTSMTLLDQDKVGGINSCATRTE